jgi:site-specific DNA-methyltransferase (adenine-specific)
VLTQTILQIDCRLVTLDYIRQLHCMITDPPFSPHVHENAVSASASGGVNLRGVEERDLGFAALDDTTRAWLMQAAGAVKRWSAIYSDIESTHKLRELAVRKDMSEAKRKKQQIPLYLRTIPWIRWSSPQLHGGTPPSGREDLCFFHSDVDGVSDIALFYGNDGAKMWNGPGNLTHLNHKCLRGSGKHKAEKPLDQALDLVSYFSNPGEWVFDPFSGSGTTGLACALLGRGFVGCELDPTWAAFGQARLVDPLSERDLERAGRWLGPRDPNAGQPGDTETGPTGIRRAAARAHDREFFLAQPRIAPFVAKLLAA